MLLCGAEHPLYAKKMGQVPCLFSYLRTRRITYKMDNSVVVSLRDIVVEFDGQRILDGLNLDIHDKEFVTLLGSSGCGKTTTLRLIAGFLEPNAGKVLLKGKDITGVPPYKRPVNTVFQKYALFPHLNVFENVAFGLRLKKLDEDTIRRKVRDMLEVVGLKGFERRSIGQMSGGQQQRVAIARSLVNEPEILLLDEPLGALDLKLRKEMQLELKRLQREMNITFIYVTHDQEEALAVSDRIAVMNGGVICQIGRPADIYKRPKNVFVSTFIGLSNLLDGHIVKKGDKTSISFKENEDWLVDMDNLSGGVEDGEEVIISVRPEEFDMEPGTKEGIRGVIRSSVFLGLTTHYFITTGSGQELEILQTQEGQDILPDGSAVTLTVKAGRINVFRRATEETLIREEGL